MSYDEMMAQQFPAAMTARTDIDNHRPPFRVARRFQDAGKSHSAAVAAAVESQVATFVDTKRRERVDTLPIESGSVYTLMARANEIRVLEVLPAKFEQPIMGSLHHVSVDFKLLRDAQGWEYRTDFAISVSEAAMVYYTALSYVVSISWNVDRLLILANEFCQTPVGIFGIRMCHYH